MFPYLDMRQIGGRYSDVEYLLFDSVKIGWYHDHIRPGIALAMPGFFLFWKCFWKENSVDFLFLSK